jgi:hypothetical protein
MKLNIRTPRQSLNKAFLKVKPNRNDIEKFKTNFIKLIDHIHEPESEEYHKNLVSEFLKNTYYKDIHFINTKGRNDLVIHNGKDAQHTVGVIIEIKKPGNKSEMLRSENMNVKAFQELLLYYLRERVTLKNLEIKYLIATDIYEWFIFDAQLFERLFANNKQLIKKFNNFEEKRLSDTRTDFFYKEIAEPFINAIETEITFTHFDIRNYEKPLRNADKKDDNKLIALYKLLSPEHLLKLPFANDSNSLDKGFYTELLHIIGLAETKEGGKKLIGRKKVGERDAGSLIESAIIQLDSLDKISRLENASRYGSTHEERFFNIALELSITWVNRILFLKLLEAQLLNYNNGDKSFSFLNNEKIKNFDDLNSLFFQVLARKPDERTAPVKKIFSNVPYLNSSLFEPTEIEHQGLFISQLRDTQLRIINSTVLKDQTGRKKSGAFDTLEYIFAFLDAYDFGGDGAEEIQEDNKTLINASVLGLIFEKINGYKDGSFFTPGFITMYMCRETIRRAVVQKFNDVKKWKCQDIDQLYDKIENRQEANQIINDLKICDPAVGSGHFLVSALNEIIAVKNDLKILSDRDGKRLKEYSVEVVSDELIVTDEDGKIFEYNPRNKESQRVQEALFHEKQTIIENCLFGLDINTNSVKICRLRLWIELLKNAYYKAPTFTELETLPNIDINIKCGNSLISRYSLDANIKEALRNSKWSIDSYRLAVMTYRNAENKEQKQAMVKLIEQIKSDFESKVLFYDRRIVRLGNAKLDIKTHIQQTPMFELSKKQKSDWEKRLKKLTAEIKNLEAELEEEKNNKIYENAFEWRFEFPEVLNDNGDFVGFDVVIGNPPYMNAIDFKKSVGEKEYKFYKGFYETAKGTVDLYVYFFEFGFKILKGNQYFCFITPNRYLSANYGIALRQYLIQNYQFIRIGDYSSVKVFAEASIYPIVSLLKKSKPIKNYIFKSFTFVDEIKEPVWRDFNSNLLNYLNDNILGFILSSKFAITKKVIDVSISLSEAGIINATSTAGEAEKYHDYIENDTSGFKLVNTGTIDRYAVTWGIYELTDKGVKYLKPYLPKNKEILGQNRYELYGKQKIIFSKIALRTEAFYDEKGCYASINTNCMYSFSSDYDPYYILGWLNSKLFQYVFECFFDGLKMAGGYLLYSAPNINNMYIKKISHSEQIPIANYVLKLTAKKQNPNADTSELEKEIDKLVYQLYGLTDEEIQIVEQAVT